MTAPNVKVKGIWLVEAVLLSCPLRTCLPVLRRCYQHWLHNISCRKNDSASCMTWSLRTGPTPRPHNKPGCYTNTPSTSLYVQWGMRLCHSFLRCALTFADALLCHGLGRIVSTFIQNIWHGIKWQYAIKRTSISVSRAATMTSVALVTFMQWRIPRYISFLMHDLKAANV